MADSARSTSILGLAILVEGGMFAVAVGLGALIGQPAVGGLTMTVDGLGWGVSATFPLLLMAWFSLWSKWPIFVRLRETARVRVVPMFQRVTVLELAVISMLAGVGEEALFRGVFHAVISDAANVWVAVVVVSVLFGLLHFVSLTYAVLAAFIGAYLAGLLIVFDNLFVPMVTHAAYDFLALMMLMRTRFAVTPGEGGPPES